MSFRRFTQETGEYRDHRVRVSTGPGIALDPEEIVDAAPPPGARRSSGLLGRARGGGPQGQQMRRRYHHVRPVYAPLPWSDPLPYEDPMERALRWNS